MIHSQQKMDMSQESVVKYNEPQAELRAYTIGHIIKDLIDVRSVVHKLETIKVW